VRGLPRLPSDGRAKSELQQMSTRRATKERNRARRMVCRVFPFGIVQHMNYSK
jgi:hypothetical protein